MYVFFFVIVHCLWRVPHTGVLVNKANEVGLIKKHILSLMGHYLPFLYDKTVFSEKWIKKKQTVYATVYSFSRSCRQQNKGQIP